jgi:hypothetical protein
MIEDEKRKSGAGQWLLQHLAVAYAEAGDFPEALRAVERMNAPLYQVTALAGEISFSLTYRYPFEQGVALLQAKTGDKALARKMLERAAELIASIPEDSAHADHER